MCVCVRERERERERERREIEKRGRYKIMISPIPGGPVSELCRTLERIRGPLEEGAAGDDGYPTHVAPRVASTATLGPPTVTRATLHSAASSSRHDVIVYRVSWSRDASVVPSSISLLRTFCFYSRGGLARSRKLFGRATRASWPVDDVTTGKGDAFLRSGRGRARPSTRSHLVHRQENCTLLLVTSLLPTTGRPIGLLAWEERRGT